MAVAYGATKTAVVRYSFAADGGAISTIQLGRPGGAIPDNAVITYFAVKPSTTFTSGGGATVAFGWTGDTDALMVVTAFGAFVADQVILGRDFNAVPVTINNASGRQPAITIAAAALTAGVADCIIRYVELDL